jgi:hypothetical protein
MYDKYSPVSDSTKKSFHGSVNIPPLPSAYHARRTTASSYHFAAIINSITNFCNLIINEFQYKSFSDNEATFILKWIQKYIKFN